LVKGRDKVSRGTRTLWLKQYLLVALALNLLLSLLLLLDIENLRCLLAAYYISRSSDASSFGPKALKTIEQ